MIMWDASDGNVVVSLGCIRWVEDETANEGSWVKLTFVQGFDAAALEAFKGGTDTRHGRSAWPIVGQGFDGHGTG